MLTTKAAKKRFEQKLLANFFFPVFSENFLMVWEHWEFKVAFLQLPLFLEALKSCLKSHRRIHTALGVIPSHLLPKASLLREGSARKGCGVGVTGL